jgi:hypothetical protein
MCRPESIRETPGARCRERSLEEGRRVGAHGQIGLPAIAGQARRDVHLQQPRAVGGHAVAVAGDLREPRADGQYHVRGEQALLDRVRRREAVHAEVEPVGVGEDVGPPPGGDDRQLERLGELHQARPGGGAQHPGAGQDQRRAGTGQGLEYGRHLGRRRPRPLGLSGNRR